MTFLAEQFRELIDLIEDDLVYDYASINKGLKDLERDKMEKYSSLPYDELLTALTNRMDEIGDHATAERYANVAMDWLIRNQVVTLPEIDDVLMNDLTDAMMATHHKKKWELRFYAIAILSVLRFKNLLHI